MNDNKVVYSEDSSAGVRTIYLNQPAKKNAISTQMMDLLVDELLDADDDAEVRVIILRGAGRDFSSGGDLDQDAPGHTGPEWARRSLHRYGRALQTVRRIAKPVIAMVDGYAVGGAFSLILACDLVCASERAQFVPAFCQIGIIPEMAMMKYLPELVGAQRAKELIFFGGKIPAARMADLGLVNELVPAEELEAATLRMADRLAAQSDASIQLAKSMLNSIDDDDLDAILVSEETASPFCTTTEAFKKAAEKFKK